MEEVLRVEKVTKKFGDFVALRGVTLTIQHRITSIIGPNGAGKTTLINVITGFLKPEGGSIYFHNRDITRLPPHRRVQLGIVRTFQVTKLFPEFTVSQNIQIPLLSLPKNKRKDLNYILDLFNLTRYKDTEAVKLPHGLQRVVQLAVAYALNPRLLLLDEPTAGLTPYEKDRVVNVIRQVAQTTPVVIVEHDLNVVFNLSDEVVVMHHGEVIARGTPQEIANNSVVREIYVGT